MTILLSFATLQENSTYRAREWIKNDDKVWLLELKYRLYEWIKRLSEFLRFSEVLFINDDVIANEILDKRRQPLLEWSVSGRHWGHYWWCFIQSYCVIPKNFRRQAMVVFVCYPKERADRKAIHDENDALTDDKLVAVRGILRDWKHSCLYIRNKFPHGFCVK